MQSIRTLIITLVAILTIGNGLWAGWRQDGGRLNISTSESASSTCLAIRNGATYISWTESDGSVWTDYPHVKSWNGSGWQELGTRVHSISVAGQNLAVDADGKVYVAVKEFDASGNYKHYVKYWSGSYWQTLGSYYQDGYGETSPHMLEYSGKIHVAYPANISYDKLFVKYWNSSTASWSQLGTTLNAASYRADYPCMAYNKTSSGLFAAPLYAAWVQYNGSSVDQIYVKNYAHNLLLMKYVWTTVGGGCLNVDATKDAAMPIMKGADDGSMYVAWTEVYSTSPAMTRIYVKQWNGSAWNLIGGNLTNDANQHAVAGGLEIYNNTPYVTWQEKYGSIYQTYVKYWNGSSWVQLGGCLNCDATKSSGDPQIAFNGSVPYISFVESNGSSSMLYMKHWIDGVNAVAPNYGLTGKTVTLTVSGESFGTLAGVKLIRQGATDIAGTSLVKNSDYSTTATFDLAGATPGLYTIQVTTANGCQQSLKQAFTVLEAAAAGQVWNMDAMGQAGSSTLAGAFGGLAIGDADGDGSQELYVASLGTQLYQFKRVNVSWAVSGLPSQTTGNNYASVLLADNDGDQTPEVFGGLLNRHAHRFNGTSWAKKTDIDTTSASYGGAMIYAEVKADLDHNGVDEIYAAGDTGGTNRGTVYQLTNPDSTYNSITAIAGCADSPVYGLAVGDGNGDGEVELYSANADGKLYQLKLSGSWAVTEMGGGSEAMQRVAVGDGDNDAKPEVYAVSHDGKVWQFRYLVSSWSGETVGTPSSDALYGVAVSDGNNDGANEVYAASANGHAYALQKGSSQWTLTDLGNAGSPLYALTVGDADNNNRCEVYALGENRQVYQFYLDAPAPTATPTATVTMTPAPVPVTYFKIFNNQINPNHGQQAVLRWSQPSSGPVTITVYNLLGERIVRLADNQDFPAGQFNEIRWNGRNAKGSVVGDGIYVVTFSSEGHTARGRIAVVK